MSSPGACTRERVLLQAVDWRAVDPTKVERLLDVLSAESIRLPGWLAKALVVGGHALPAMYQAGLDAQLNALNGLNNLEAANAA